MSNAPELSAREFFMQDDSALGAAIGLASEPAKAPEPVSAQEPTQKEEIVQNAPATEDDSALQEGNNADAATDDETVVAEAETGTSDESSSDVAEGVTPVLKDKPITEFTVYDEQGDLLPPDIRFKFKAVGQERDIRIDQLVRMAQMGFTNEEREKQVASAKKFVSEAEQKIASYEALIAQYDEKVARLLEDDSVYEEARIEWNRRNAPEMRAARAEQEAAQLREERQMERESAFVGNFVQSVLVPTTSHLLEENPLVTETELIGRYTQLTAPLLVNGRVPINRLPEVERLVKTDLAEWVQARNIERSQTKQVEKKETAKQVKQVADAKRAASRVLAPTGKAGLPKQQKTTFSSARDWLDSQFSTN